MRKQIHLIILLIPILFSCEKEPVDIIYADFEGKRGVFISCEGNFMYGNASLSFYDKENKVVYNNIFSGRNRAPLGDVAHSLASDGKYLYIVVNNSGKIVAIDPKTLEFRKSVTGLVSPRYIHFINSTKAYISDLYARRITIFNPSTFEKTGFIDVSDGKNGSAKHTTETFARVGNRIFVSCWAFDNQILVINPDTDTIIDSIRVPMQPRKIVVDINNKLWVQCDGNFALALSGTEMPALVRIDPETLTVEQIFRWNTATDYAGDLQINPAKDKLYIVKGDLYNMAVNSRRIPEIPLINARKRLFFSVGVDPHNGDIYLADAIDYLQNAMVYRYSANGIAIDSFRVGVNPGSFLFN
jgi:DNA-binding beta-propeller fold protein YncE